MIRKLGIGLEAQTILKKERGGGLMEVSGSSQTGPQLGHGHNQTILLAKIVTRTVCRFTITNMPRMGGMTIIATMQ